MSEIADLLEKLKQLDPATWKEFTDDMGSIICDGGCEESTEIYFTHDNCWTHVSEAWLQFCIQRSIMTRKWHIQTGFGGDSLECWAYIFLEKTFLGEGPTPASALLACYITCLESQP